MKYRLSIPLLLVSILTISCGDSEKTAQSEIIDPANFTEPTHTATQVVLIEETDDFFFGNIRTVQPTSKGDILVGDFTAMKFWVFNQNGDLVGEIGKEGSGPGEFKQLGKAYVGHNDTLFVMDWSNARISAFTESSPGKWAHQLDIPIVRPSGEMLTGFFHFGAQGMAGQYSPGFSASGEDTEIQPQVSRINRAGEKVGDPIATYRQIDSKIQTGTNWAAQYPIPFGKNGYVRESDDAIHVADNEFLGATTISLDGDTLHHFRHNFVQRPVTEDLIHDRFNGDFTTDFYKAVSDMIPQVRPAFDSFHADNEGNLFFSFNDVADDTHLWLKYRSDGELLASFMIPSGTNVHRIYNNKLYCSAGADDLPYVVVYELIEN